MNKQATPTNIIDNLKHLQECKIQTIIDNDNILNNKEHTEQLENIYNWLIKLKALNNLKFQIIIVIGTKIKTTIKFFDIMGHIDRLIIPSTIKNITLWLESVNNINELIIQSPNSMNIDENCKTLMDLLHKQKLTGSQEFIRELLKVIMAKYTQYKEEFNNKYKDTFILDSTDIYYMRVIIIQRLGARDIVDIIERYRRVSGINIDKKDLTTLYFNLASLNNISATKETIKYIIENIIYFLSLIVGIQEEQVKQNG